MFQVQDDSLLLPNIPEAVILFYALNKIGAVSNMVHPLSSNEEIKNILKKKFKKMIRVLTVPIKISLGLSL